MIKTPASVLDLLSLSMKRKRFVRIFCIWKSESLLLGDKNSYCTTFVSSTFSLVKHHVTLIRLLFNNTFFCSQQRKHMSSTNEFRAKHTKEKYAPEMERKYFTQKYCLSGMMTYSMTL